MGPGSPTPPCSPLGPPGPARPGAPLAPLGPIIQGEDEHELRVNSSGRFKGGAQS